LIVFVSASMRDSMKRSRQRESVSTGSRRAHRIEQFARVAAGGKLTGDKVAAGRAPRAAS
jgi:hypothetical protein